MAVKIRLKRLGKIRAPYYRIVVADSRTKRDGRVIEEIGKYHPTEQVAAILKLTGDWGKFKGDKDAVSTVLPPEGKAAFVVDEKKKPVLVPKSEKKAAPKAEEAPAEEAAAEEAPAAEEAAEETAEAPAAETDEA